MTVSVRVERSGAAVLEVLRQVSPHEADVFATGLRAALVRATESLDLAESKLILTRWWSVAHLRLPPPDETELDVVRRLRAGKDVGWSSPEEYQAAKST